MTELRPSGPEPPPVEGAPGNAPPPPAGTLAVRVGAALRQARGPLVVWLLVALALLATQGSGRFELAVPWIYKSDALIEGATVKSVIDNGWAPWRQTFLGAPFGTTLFDYPGADGLNTAIVRLLALFSGDWVVVLNAFYLLGFFLAATTAYWVLRQFGIDLELAILGGLLFSFIPYHFLRPPHFFLSSYYAVPMAIWLAAWVWEALPDLPAENRRRTLVAVGVGVLLSSSTGIYYAFFACATIVLAALAGGVSSRSLRPIKRGAAIVVAISSLVIVNLAPSLYYQAVHGPNPAVAKRQPFESELYGLKISQLLLPSPKHRVEGAAALGSRYYETFPVSTENYMASLGVLGALGLLLVFARAFSRLVRETGPPRLEDRLGLMALAMIGFATVGGFATLFALFVTPSLRALNRISIFIAFIAIASLLFWLQKWARPWLLHSGSRRARIAVAAACLGLAGFGIWEQSTVFRRDGVAEFDSDRKFVAVLEHALPRAAMVYQMPYHPFPESGNRHTMEDYSLLRGYLHSSGLRWSYGAMKGREGDTWLRALGQKPLREQVSEAKSAGFDAVYVDRRGFADKGGSLTGELTTLLGSPIASSPDGALIAWRIAIGSGTTMAGGDTAAGFSEPIVFSKNLFPDYIAATKGLSGAESWGRWTDGPIVRFDFSRPLPERFRLVIRTMDAFGANASMPFRVKVGDMETKFSVGHGDREVTLRLSTPRPDSSLEILVPDPRSPKEMGIAADPRKLGLALRSVQIIPEGAGP